METQTRSVAVEYQRSAALPKLAWIATLDLRSNRLRVDHGSAVECRPEWMVEGVWDGRFADGDFHRGAHLFGSGMRLDGDAIYFMPSCALVDRLIGLAQHQPERLKEATMAAALELQ